VLLGFVVRDAVFKFLDVRDQQPQACLEVLHLLMESVEIGLVKHEFGKVGHWVRWFAIAIRTSAWQGSSSGHQQARFFPASSR